MAMQNKNSINGEYVFFIDGKEVGRSKNILTKYGKRYITTYLAGQSASPAKDIAIGIGTSSPTVNNTQLDFEFYKSQVNLSSVDIQTSSSTGLTTYGVVYKTTIPNDVAGVIKEIGLFPNVTIGATDYSSRSISSFENNQYWISDTGDQAETVSTPTPLIGSSYMKITSPSNSSTKYSYAISFDLSGYSVNDSMTIAYYQSDLNLDYIYVRAYSSDDSYHEIRFPGSTSIGSKINSLTLSNLYDSGFGSGTPDNSAIVKFTVGAKAKASGATTVLMDGLRINDEDSFKPDFGLISRSVLTSPITKAPGRQMDIEYRLGINF